MSASDVARAFGLGTPAAELTFVARGAMGEVFVVEGCRAAAEVVPMVHAYRDAGGAFAPTDLTVFAMAFSANVHYVVQCCENLDNGAGEAVTEFERPVLQRLATSNSLTLERFERLLEMVPA